MSYSCICASSSPGFMTVSMKIANIENIAFVKRRIFWISVFLPQNWASKMDTDHRKGNGSWWGWGLLVGNMVFTLLTAWYEGGGRLEGCPAWSSDRAELVGELGGVCRWVVVEVVSLVTSWLHYVLLTPTSYRNEQETNSLPSQKRTALSDLLFKFCVTQTSSVVCYLFFHGGCQRLYIVFLNRALSSVTEGRDREPPDTSRTFRGSVHCYWWAAKRCQHSDSSSQIPRITKWKTFPDL